LPTPQIQIEKDIVLDAVEVGCVVGFSEIGME